MDGLQDRYYLGTESSSPVIKYRVFCDEVERTGKDTADVNIRVDLLRFASPDINYNYKITGYAVVNGVRSNTITIKEKDPGYWSSSIVVYFDTMKITGIDENTDTLTGTVYLSSTEGRKSDTGLKTIRVPLYNAPPYWTDSKYCNIKYYHGSELKELPKSKIIPENTEKVQVNWGGAKDDEQDEIRYDLYLGVDGKEDLCTTYGTNDTQYETDISQYGEGSNFYFKICCSNLKSTTKSMNDEFRSDTFVKNIFTPAKISCDNNSIIKDSSSKVKFNIEDASNTDGNTEFTYTLSSPQITIYNGEFSSFPSSIELSVWDSDMPDGPCIKWEDLKSCFRIQSFKGEFEFILTTKNAYNTVKETSVTVPVNLQRAPTTPVFHDVENYDIIDGQKYYVVNQKPIRFSWSRCTDNLDTRILYQVQMKINGGSWQNCGEISTSYHYIVPIMNIKKQGTIKLRARAWTIYEIAGAWAESEEIPIHYYNPPIIKNLEVKRTDYSQITTAIIEEDTSIPGINYSLNVEYKEGSEVLETQTIDMDGSCSIRYAQNIGPDKTFTETVSITDNISSDIFNLPPVCENVIVPPYSAIMTIREKGVGINTVSGDFTDLIVKGTTSFWGEKTTEKSDGSINFATDESSNINMYLNAYMDLNGDLITTRELKPEEYVYQIQVGTNQEDKKSNNTPPLRWRYMYASEKVNKGKKFESDYKSDWMTFIDSAFNGANISTNVTTYNGNNYHGERFNNDVDPEYDPEFDLKIYRQGNIVTIQGQIYCTRNVSCDDVGHRDILMNLPFEPIASFDTNNATQFTQGELVLRVSQDRSIYIFAGNQTVQAGSHLMINLTYAVK